MSQVVLLSMTVLRFVATWDGHGTITFVAKHAVDVLVVEERLG